MADTSLANMTISRTATDNGNGISISGNMTDTEDGDVTVTGTAQNGVDVKVTGNPALKNISLIGETTPDNTTSAETKRDVAIARIKGAFKDPCAKPVAIRWLGGESAE